MGLPDEIAQVLKLLEAKYDFQEASEKGGNGYLFIARNRVLDRTVAIKFYYWADGTREHIEPKSLDSIGSSSVIEVLDAALVGAEWAMFVTPFYNNGDLDRFRETNQFGLRDAIRFTASLLDGVAALHQKGFAGRKDEELAACLPLALRRANDVDHRLAFLHVDRPETALECRHHLGRIGDLLAVAVSNFDGLLIIRDAIQERDRLVLTLRRVTIFT